jgi:teichoic acid transport system permease protein
MQKIIREHLEARNQIFQLARFDLRKTYRGSALGWLWSLARPLTMLLVYWFVFSIAVGATTGYKGIGYFSWLAVGMLAWFYMSDMLGKGTNSFKSYRYLITKMKFPVSVIPTFVGLSNLAVHLVLISIVAIYLGINGDGLHIQWVQLPLYTLFMFLFFVAWSLFAAPVATISKDFANLVKSTVRILFWLSGILWSVQKVDIEWIQTAMLFNPVYFFVEGYRKSLLYGEWFYEDMKALLIFLTLFITLIIIAVTSYKRNRKQLVDEL